MRKRFIDNLRWMAVFLLIPYHAAQAFNTWGEPNYISFSGNRPISTFIVCFSPFLMPLLFLLAGMSSRYALMKRTYGQYIVERIKRLIVPLIFGTLVFCPVLAYIGDQTNFGYEGSFFSHYGVFFTKWTDLTGYDGGFNVGQFWFLLYLFIISLVSAGIIALTHQAAVKIPYWGICLMVVPLPFLYDLLSVGGKSFAEYFYIFLIGFYVMSDDKAIEEVEKYRCISLSIGLAAAIANVYLFLWSGRDFGTANVITKAFAEWFMILALIGNGKRHLDFSDKTMTFMAKNSFPFYCIHFLWIVLFQYWFSDVLGEYTVLLFLVPVVCAYAATLVCADLYGELNDKFLKKSNGKVRE
ncbi:MAG: acyltransferase [Lachnospiraceae bacterium]|nr:acyltransferase [Lachnospiraceae bacterium]